MDCDVVVVGAGLAGLTAAVALHDAGRTVAVVEARAQVGGRIKTLTDGDLCLDLGATWHWSNQPAVRALAAAMGMEVFPQFRDGRAVVEEDGPPRRVVLPRPDPTELRFVGGAQGLCHRLAGRLPEASVILETDVTVVAAAGDGMRVTTAAGAGEERELSCGAVVIAVPPRLAHAGITFTPALPGPLVQVMQGTPTFMANAVKCLAVYESPFWRDDGLSGLAFSGSGPLIEVHDGCTEDASTAALGGFMSGWHEFRDLEPPDRRDLVFAHLGRFFGAGAADPVRYFERDWSDDPYTNDEVVWLSEPLPYGNAAFTEPLLGGRLVWAGTETAGAGAGHMEGAVRSGQRASSLLQRRFGGSGAF
ncbi:MAG TPA: FAD-dependent oxidoreductase [Acidimicrobiales bacterium]|nr:FAD-dependent oxidoreductase [Acidimicrobiales bacterium]